MRTLRNQETVIENLDRYDIKQYEDILMQSGLFKNMEAEGSKILPSFPSLQRDLWGGLYKYEPVMKGMVDKELYINKEIMRRILNNPEFQGFREYTKLDELASALGCVNMSEKVNDVIKYVAEEQRKAQEALKKQQEQAKQKREEANKLQQMLNQLQQQMQDLQQKAQDNQPEPQYNQQETDAQNPQNNEQQHEQLQQQLEQLQQQAQKAEKAAKSAENKVKSSQDFIQQQLEKAMNSQSFSQKLTQAVNEAQQKTEEEKKEVNLLMGGLKAGTGSIQKQGNLLNNLQIVEELRRNKVLKKTLDLAGKMKMIALKKQKEKVTDTTQKAEVELGNSPERLLPTELLLYNNPETRQIFMKRFAEGETLQYGTTEKEHAGKGPVIACIDISGSMGHMLDGSSKRSEWAKAVAFALWTIAQKQKRAFYCVEFDTSVQSSYKVTKDNVIDLLKAKECGGTSFYPPLAEAFHIMKNEKTFKKSDIIFITDGESNVVHLNELLDKKKSTRTSIYSIQLSSDSTYSLEQFSDQVIRYDPKSQDFAKIFEI